MKRRRVKITGIGPVTPAGIGREPYWKGILEPVSRVRPYHGIGKQYGPLVAAHMDEFDIDRYVDRTLLPKGSARHTLFAAAAATLALKDAGISPDELAAAATAVITGSTLFDFGAIVRGIDAVHQHGVRGAKGRGIYTTSPASVPGAINDVLGIRSNTMVLQSSCASGIDAIGHAAELIATGQAELAICGGTDAPLHRSPMLEFRAAGLTPPNEELAGRIARPFDLWRTTGVISEGACMFVLEAESSPRAGYSFITGYGYASDPADDLCGGLLISGAKAIADARIHLSDIDVVSAWAPGHKLIDAAEARTMKGLFGEILPGIPFLSIKGAVGSPLGAAGPMQVAAAALGQRNGMVPPTVNWQFPDPECALNLSNCERSLDHRVTLVNAHGLSGMNTSMVLEKC